MYRLGEFAKIHFDVACCQSGIAATSNLSFGNYYGKLTAEIAQKPATNRFGYYHEIGV